MPLISDKLRVVFVYTKLKMLLISHKEEKMQWILADIPLGRNIQRVRLKKNMTQGDIVAKMQLRGSIMSRSTLANIETGRINIKASDLKLLKSILDVNYEEFFRAEDSEV